MGWIKNLHSAWRESSLRKRGYVPPEEIQIPKSGSYYVVELRGVRMRSAKIYRDGNIIYSVDYNEKSGDKSDIRFTTPEGDHIDWGYSGYAAHDVIITRSDGSIERAHNNTHTDDLHYSDDAPRLFGEYRRAQDAFEKLIPQLPLIRIIFPDEDAPKAARNLGWRKLEQKAATAPIYG